MERFASSTIDKNRGTCFYRMTKKAALIPDSFDKDNHLARIQFAGIHKAKLLINVNRAFVSGFQRKIDDVAMILGSYFIHNNGQGLLPVESFGYP